MIISVILLLLGVYFTGLGLFFLYQNRRSELVEVKLEVIAFEEQEDHEHNKINVPVYKVFAGEYQGVTKLSVHDETNYTETLKVGDLIDGFIDLPNQDLISNNGLPMKNWMPVWLIVIGVGLLFAGFYFFL